MAWSVALVRDGTVVPADGMVVFRLGTITAPSGPDGVGLDVTTAHRMVAAVEAQVAVLQEEALRVQAETLRFRQPALRLKDYRCRTLQTLFGPVVLRVPRLVSTDPHVNAPRLFNGSARSSQAYQQLRAKLGAWMSYRTVDTVLHDLFPTASGRDHSTVQRQVRRVADDRSQVGNGCVDAGPGARHIDLGLDTTFVRSSAGSGPRHHEVLIGHGRRDHGRQMHLAGVIGAVDAPHLRINATLRTLGHEANTLVTVFTDGDRMLRQYLRKAGLPDLPILDWAHIARRVQHVRQSARGLRCEINAEHRAKPRIIKALDRVHWRLWHGRTAGAVDLIRRVRDMLKPFDISRPWVRQKGPAKRLHTALVALDDYVSNQSAHLVDYARRHRAGKPVGTATTEGAANALVNRRMNKAQQMRWSAAGAEAVLAIRTEVVNGTFPPVGRAA